MCAGKKKEERWGKKYEKAKYDQREALISSATISNIALNTT